MDKQIYWGLLLRAEWREKRREIIERDNSTCTRCGKHQSELPSALNVHHTYYKKGKKPWEYPNESLKTLCEKCHEETHEEMKIKPSRPGPKNRMTKKHKRLAKFMNWTPPTPTSMAPIGEDNRESE